MLFVSDSCTQENNAGRNSNVLPTIHSQLVQDYLSNGCLKELGGGHTPYNHCFWIYCLLKPPFVTVDVPWSACLWLFVPCLNGHRYSVSRQVETHMMGTMKSSSVRAKVSAVIAAQAWHLPLQLASLWFYLFFPIVFINFPFCMPCLQII